MFSFRGTCKQKRGASSGPLELCILGLSIESQASCGRTALHLLQPASAHERHSSPSSAMQVTVGSYVRIHEQCRNRAVRGLLCRVQALEFRLRLSTFVPMQQYAQVRVLGLEEHIQGDTPEWWMPCSAMRYVGDASSCIGTHDAQAAARCFLPFLFGCDRLSTGAIESSLEVSHVQWKMMSVAARLRQARASLRPGPPRARLRRVLSPGGSLRRERVDIDTGNAYGTTAVRSIRPASRPTLSPGQ
jgi:hypothetical protein